MRKLSFLVPVLAVAMWTFAVVVAVGGSAAYGVSWYLNNTTRTIVNPR